MAEIGYLFGSRFWGRGYAGETVTAMVAHLQGGGRSPQDPLDPADGVRPRVTAGERLPGTLTWWSMIGLKGTGHGRTVDRSG